MRWRWRLTHDGPRPLLAACVCLLAALLFAGCGNSATARASATQPPAAQPTATATAAPTTPAIPTRTPGAGCSTVGSVPGMATTLALPLPPRTVSQILPSAAGAGFFLECTPGMTQASITSYLNTAYLQAGWRQWNPQTDNAYGCGTEPNNFWQWSDSQEAVGWDFSDMSLPEWHLAVCALAGR